MNLTSNSGLGSPNEILDRIKLNLNLPTEYDLCNSLDLDVKSLKQWRAENEMDLNIIVPFLVKNNLRLELLKSSHLCDEEFGHTVEIAGKSVYVINKAFGLMLVLGAWRNANASRILPYYQEALKNDFLCIIFTKEKLVGLDTEISSDEFDQIPDFYYISSLYDIINDGGSELGELLYSSRDRIDTILDEKIKTNDFVDSIKSSLNIDKCFEDISSLL